MKDEIGDVQGKQILDYGCGEGWITAELAAMGGFIESFDISGRAVSEANELLKRRNLDKNCRITKMAAEELQYADNSFDIVVGFAILHHVDLDRAMPELFRVMRRPGRAYFAEPLRGNPIINLYRKLTPSYRTINEAPLVLRDFATHASMFGGFSHRDFYVTALFPVFMTHVPILSRLYGSTIGPFMKIDEILLRHFSSLSRLAWYSMLTLEK